MERLLLHLKPEYNLRTAWPPNLNLIGTDFIPNSAVLKWTSTEIKYFFFFFAYLQSNLCWVPKPHFKQVISGILFRWIKIQHALLMKDLIGSDAGVSFKIQLNHNKQIWGKTAFANASRDASGALAHRKQRRKNVSFYIFGLNLL